MTPGKSVTPGRLAGAVCVGQSERMFSDDPETRRLAIAELCGHCPVTGACLAYALERPERSGVWGGHDLTTPPVPCPTCGHGRGRPCNGGLTHRRRVRLLGVVGP